MLSFIKYLIEANKFGVLDPNQPLLHTTHLSSLHLLSGHEGANHASNIMDHVLTSIKRGRASDSIRRKWDGSPSMLSEGGQTISTKSFANKIPKKASTPEQINSMYGHSEGLRDTLTNALHSLRHVVPGNMSVQMDQIHNPKSLNIKGNESESRPNPTGLTYHFSGNEHRRAASSTIGIAPHTVYNEKGGARPITRSEFSIIEKNATKNNVHVLSPFIDENIKGTPDEEKKLAYHKSEYDRLNEKQHKTGAHAALERHANHIETYVNSEVWKGGKPSVKGYKQYLKDRATKAESSVKTPSKKMEKRKPLDDLHSHASKNEEHLDNHFQMYYHADRFAGLASNISNRNSKIKSSISGQPFNHEGISVSLNGRPPIKLVSAHPNNIEAGARAGFSALNRMGRSKINESTQSTAVLSVGKIRYATPGHAKMIRHAKEIAKKLGADLHIHLTGTSDPLTPEQKISHAQAMFGHPVESTKNVFDSLQRLTGKHHSLHIVAGSDRADEYRNLPSEYKDKSGKVIYSFPGGIHVHEVPGKRVLIADIGKHPSKMNRNELEKSSSATEVIGLAKKGDYEGFKAYHPGVPDKIVQSNYNTIRKQSVKEEHDPMIVFRKFIDAKRSGSKGGNGGGNGNGN
jgi:hypothetical protein